MVLINCVISRICPTVPCQKIRIIQCYVVAVVGLMNAISFNTIKAMQTSPHMSRVYTLVVRNLRCLLSLLHVIHVLYNIDNIIIIMWRVVLFDIACISDPAYHSNVSRSTCSASFSSLPRIRSCSRAPSRRTSPTASGTCPPLGSRLQRPRRTRWALSAIFHKASTRWLASGACSSVVAKGSAWPSLVPSFVSHRCCCSMKPPGNSGTKWLRFFKLTANETFLQCARLFFGKRGASSPAERDARPHCGHHRTPPVHNPQRGPSGAPRGWCCGGARHVRAADGTIRWVVSSTSWASDARVGRITVTAMFSSPSYDLTLPLLYSVWAYMYFYFWIIKSTVDSFIAFTVTYLAFGKVQDTSQPGNQRCADHLYLTVAFRLVSSAS